MTSTNIVKLNIGGTVFQTTKSTLTRFDGFFKTLLETSVSVEKDENGCIFVDRDPQHFRFILNFMRDGDVVLPTSEHDVQEILKEAQFYLLEGLMEGRGAQFSAKETTTVDATVGNGTNKVRVLENYEGVHQLRDRTKPLLMIGYMEEFSENFLHPSNIVLFFVQKHEPRFDIFFYPDSSAWTCTISNYNNRTILSVDKYKNIEDWFLSVEGIIDRLQ